MFLCGSCNAWVCLATSCFSQAVTSESFGLQCIVALCFGDEVLSLQHCWDLTVPSLLTLASTEERAASAVCHKGL